ncbi:unnamed protein product [Dracunculus medinensis]|uniref:WD_REPEATS_REGION domain-containing protein n=1 Tax=Dracunculus medinensis TaxID=318479 RepID=A0A158Q2N4_DRAME|nr:unnamed protein product [Dracunculus medinensis]
MINNRRSFEFTTSLIFNDQHQDLIHHVEFDYYGRRLATSSSDSTICVWDLKPNATWIKSSSWKSHTGPIWKVIWAHPEFGQILATCSFDRSIIIWEETKLLFAKHSDFHISNTGIHSERKKGNKFWKRCCQLVDSRHNVTDIKFAPKHLGLMIATVSSQGILRVYEAPDVMNLSSWGLVHDFTALPCRCSALSWSTNRLSLPLIAVSSDDAESSGKHVVIFEFRFDKSGKHFFWNWRDVTSLKINDPVTDIAFAPSAGRSYHMLAIASKDISIYKITEVNKRMDDEMFDTGEPIEYETTLIESLEGSSQSTMEKSSKRSDVHKDITGIIKPTDYEISLLESLEHPYHPAILIWRISWNITGTVLTAGSSDGVIRVWKSSFLKKWTLISVIKANESKKEDDALESGTVTDLAQTLAKDNHNVENREEINKLRASHDIDALRSRMCGKLKFGTAGIRARMEAGFNRLNDLTILMLTHGFVTHMKKFYKNDCKGFAIGYDGRYNSKRWADLAANVFVKNGIKVYVFSTTCPTPLAAYATSKLNCGAGLMITASHNPKDDNGYKAYWANGAQILAPHDDEICRYAYETTELKDEYWNLSDLTTNPLYNLADSVIDEYYKEEAYLCHHRSTNQACQLKFTYSAFHGVGLPYFCRIMDVFGFPANNIVIVEAQAKPDPEFPTVPFPNPEEGLSVLKLSIETADRNGSTIILANDPDADRFQLAEKQANDEWRVFSGNEMGTLITWWMWLCWREKNPSADPSNVYFLNSTVSSSVVKTMADKEGFKNELTLTGFKWMGNKADELRTKGKLVILAWEESIGFMPGHSLDKDGIIAAAIFAEIASYLSSKGSSLTKQLFNIYKKYGFHLMSSSYWFVPKSDTVKNIFTKLRKDHKYPTIIGPYNVKYVRDLTVGYDNEQVDNKPILPLSTSSEMITFTLSNGSLATIRASGTEPKIKYYIELKTDPGKDEKDLGNVMDELSKLEKVVVDTLLEPELNGLIARK